MALIEHKKKHSNKRKNKKKQINKIKMQMKRLTYCEEFFLLFTLKFFSEKLVQVLVLPNQSQS